MRYTIDRFEGSFAVLIDEVGKTLDVPRGKIGEGCKEGDAVVFGESGIYQKDAMETEERKQRIARKMESLWE